MRYRELMETLGDKVQGALANSILDILTPIAANGVQSVTVQQLIDKVQKIPTGLKIDRELIMSVLDPNKFPMVKSIEGDNIYLQAPQTIRSVNDKQKDREAEKIKTTAAKQAQQAVKNEL